MVLVVVIRQTESRQHVGHWGESAPGDRFQLPTQFEWLPHDQSDEAPGSLREESRDHSNQGKRTENDQNDALDHTATHFVSSYI